MSFQIPLHFEDITRPSAGTWQISILTQREASSEQLLDQLLYEIGNEPNGNEPNGNEPNGNGHAIYSSLTSPSSTFIKLYSITTRYQNLNATQRQTLLDDIYKNNILCETYFNSSNVTHLKMALFFMAGLCFHAGNTNPICKQWDKSGKESILEITFSLISYYSSQFHSFTPADRDQISSLIIRIILNILEIQPSSAMNSKQQKLLRPLLTRFLMVALYIDERQKLSAITALLHALCRHEHIAIPLSEILDQLCTISTSSSLFLLPTNANDKNNNNNSNSIDLKMEEFVKEFIKELVGLPSNRLIHDVSASKTICNFLCDFSQRQPGMFQSNITLLLSLLNLDVYIIRNGIIHVISKLIEFHSDPNDPLFDILLQRSLCDSNAFTRSKALQCWISLIDKQNVVPNKLYPKLTAMATNRLDDKTAAVRKYSAQLLVTLLKCNPYGPVLKRSHFQSKLDQLNKQFPEENDIATEELGEQNQKTDNTATNDNENEDPNVTQEETTEHKDNQVGEIEEQDNEEGEKEEDEGEGQEKEMTEEEKQIKLKKFFYKTAVEFITTLESSSKTIFNMLRSKSITDVTESISLIVTSVQFELEITTGSAVRKMLPLTLAREQNIREKVIEAYVKLLKPEGINNGNNIQDEENEKDISMNICKRLISLTQECTIGEHTCIEQLMKNLMNDKEEKNYIITPSVIVILWDIFAGKVPNTNLKQKQYACILISVIAAHAPESVIPKLDTVLNIGLSNPNFTRWSCVTICHLSNDCHLLSLSNIHLLEERLHQLCVTSYDLSTVEQAINAIFAISPKPEIIVSGIIRQLAKNLQLSSPSSPTSELSTSSSATRVTERGETQDIENEESNEKETATEEEQSQEQSQEESSGKINSKDLSRFFVIIGQVAVKELVRIEGLVSKLKKRIANKDKDGDDSNNNDDGEQNLNIDNTNEDDEDDEEQRMLEAEYALEEGEKELISGRSILGMYGQVVRKIARDEKANIELRTSAILCLCKLMCVEKKFCENNLRLLFSIILKEDVESIIKSNAIIILGDLTFRFPNLIEPWSQYIYKPLQDKNSKVRKNTLMVLIHLILNDMIKIKGQIIHIAICILDKDEQISNLSRLFFYELSKKSSNSIYNLLPDLISCINSIQDRQSLDFKRIIQFLISLMDKEKFNDNMIEKLCHRFRSSQNDEENRNLAYCISQLNVSSKGLQKLNDRFKSYSVAILDDQVFEYLCVAFEKGNKTVSQSSNNSSGQNQNSQNAQTYEELMTKVKAVRDANGRDNDDTQSYSNSLQSQTKSQSVAQNSSQVEQNSSRDITPAKARTTRPRGRATKEATETTKSQPRRSRATGRTGGAQKRETDEELTGRTSEEETVTRPKRSTKTRKRIVVVEELSSEEEEDVEVESEGEDDDDDDDGEYIAE